LARVIRCCFSLLGTAFLAALAYWYGRKIDLSENTPWKSDAFSITVIMTAFVVAVAFTVYREVKPKRWPLLGEPEAIVTFRMRTIDRFELGNIGLVVVCTWLFLGVGTTRDTIGLTWITFGFIWAICVAAKLRSRPATLTLSPEGLDYSSFGTGPIPWCDIKSAEVDLWRPGAIAIELADLAKYHQRLPESWKARNHFAPWRFGVQPEQMLAAIQLRLTYEVFGHAPAQVETSNMLHRTTQ
jgi:hypothetical protein